MSERGLRKFHRTWGLALAAAFGAHLVTGLALAMEKAFAVSAGGGVMAVLALAQHHWHPLGNFYRLMFSFAAAVQALTGVMLFWVTMERSRQPEADREGQEVSLLPTLPLPPEMPEPGPQSLTFP